MKTQVNCLEKTREREGINVEKESIVNVPIWEKALLTKEEAVAYSHIGINRLDELLKIPNCTFVLYVGKKKLIKRKEFEKYLAENREI